MMRRWYTRACWLVLWALAAPLGAFAQSDPAIAIGFYVPVIRDVPRKDVELSLRFWIEELARSGKLDYKPVRMFDNMPDLKRAFDAGSVNLVVGTAMGLVQHFGPNDFADAFTGRKESQDDLILIAGSEAGILGPADLIGKRVSLLDGDELTDIYLGTLLMKAGHPAGLRQLGLIARESSAIKQVHNVFFGRSHAAMVYRASYETARALNPQIAQRVLVLEEFTFKTRSPYTALFSSRMSAQDRETITLTALKMGNSPRGRQIMQIYHSDVMERSYVADLGPYRELLQTFNTLTAASTRRK